MTIGLADGLVRVTNIISEYRAHSRPESSLTDLSGNSAKMKKKHSLPAPLSADDRKLLIQALTDRYRDAHPYQIKILAQNDQKCQALAAEMASIFQAAHWILLKDDVPNEFSKIGKG